MIQTLWIQQRSAWLDRLSGDDALDWQLDLFAINSDLKVNSSSVSHWKASEL